ncbi:MAG: hypothetical protein HY906_03065 [Deltaproteobacteria bacterium]|nr:hypothetical protein [Deltaproteobacteria bacterium]
MRVVVIAAVLLALGTPGCGRSTEDSVTDYCRGRLACGIDPDESAAGLTACKERYLSPEGSAHDQCVTTETAACLGDCYHAHGCGIFDMNDPCACDLKDHDCPE